MDVYAFLSNNKSPKLAKAPSLSPGDSSVKRFRNCLPMPRNRDSGQEESEEDSESSQSEESEEDSSDSETDYLATRELTPAMCRL